MIYFTSDLHLYHRRIQEFCPTTRKGKDWEEMTEIILTNMEKTFELGDVLYNLGDVAFQGVDFCRRTLQRIGQMGIQHHLILGNHDHHIRKSAELQELCTSVSHMKTIFIEKQMLVLCHFPLAQWENCEKDSIHLFGHCHGSFTQPGKCMDVGIDTRPGDMIPYTWDEIKRKMEKLPATQHHPSRMSL